MAARDKEQQPKKAAFLTAYVQTATISHAAKAAGIDRTTHYRWLENDAEYAKAFDAAHSDAVERLEAEAVRRAADGVDEPVFYKGEPVGYVRKYSDTLLIFLLKAANPEKYRERISAELTGKDGTPLAINIAGRLNVNG